MIDSRTVSRRGFIGVAGAVGVCAVLGSPLEARASTSQPVSGRASAASTTIPGAYGALGANFNELLAELEVPELQLGRTHWIRGFFPVPDADAGEVSDNDSIRTVIDLGARDYKTILTLKFPYNNSPMPTLNSPAMATALAQVDKILAAVLDKVDIIEIGNEPFIESLPTERGDVLNTFYEAVATHIIAFRRAHYGSRCRTRFYMGALNRLDLPKNQTTATERWLTFVRQTPEIDGVDIHPHVPSADAVQPFLDYILPRLRSDQTFLVTEFSLVWYWQAHLSDQISAEFANRYGFALTTLVWEVIAAAIEHPFTQEQWDYFLSTSPWYESQKYFLRNQVQNFRSTGRLAVATYGYRQGAPMTTNFGPNKAPWLLNTVFAQYTVQSWKNGTTGRGYAWLDEFQALQRGDTAPTGA